VDSHDGSRQITQRLLDRIGMETTPAVSGADALATLERADDEPADIALVDAHLAGMDGFELVERIRRDATVARLPVIILTAAGQPGDGKRCVELGIASYLMKPVTPAELRDAVALTVAQGREAVTEGGLVTRHSLREAPRPLHVLVAEDNHVNQVLAAQLVTRLGHTHRVVETGLEVLEALAEEAFDVILMDIQMPDLDGLEATSRIREREAAEGGHIPVVAMTAHAMVGDRERMLESGMDDYIAKPISRERLQEVLGRIEPRSEEARDVERA